MSLKVKCFATVIESGSRPVSFKFDSTETDGHIEIHSTPYELFPKDFWEIILHLEKDVTSYSAAIMIGDDNPREIFLTCSRIFTKYAFEEKSNQPVPIINQPISFYKNENLNFVSSRFWAYKNYFFVTNRHYSKSEIHKVKMKIHYIVKKFDDELNLIDEELKSIGVNYKNQVTKI